MLREAIFTTTIYTDDIIGPDWNLITQEIFKVREKNPKPVTMSNSGGWQNEGVDYPSNQHQFMNLIMPSILPVVKQAAADYGIYKDNFYSHYWFNVNEKFNYNKSHRHGDTLLAGCIYTKVPKNSGRLFFERPELTLRTYDNYNSNNWVEYFVEPKVGRLILFPGHLSHFVEQNLTEDVDNRRVSIAFNFR